MTAQQLTFEPSWQPPMPAEGTPESLVVGLMVGAPHVTWSRGELAYYASLPDRTVRKAIERLRRLGWPIASSSDRAGYFLATEPAELTHTIADFRHRSREIAATAEALEKAAYRLGSQAGEVAA